MKFIKTINGTFINTNEIYKVRHEHDEELDKFYSYFYLNNGEKYDVYYCPDIFQIDNSVDYEFCHVCHIAINEIILKKIQAVDNVIVDIDKLEGELWEFFIEWCRGNGSQLHKKRK